MDWNQQESTDRAYMLRCIHLAKKGAGSVAPNPMAGSVLVHNNTIIGEGYHQLYGQAHAEVNCIHSVETAKQHLIPESTLYVSLEPCAHFGKTPPCADLIIKNKIRTVVVGCRDPFPLVDGKGIEKLVAAGVEVRMGVLEKECMELNKRFFTFHSKKRPYILLKWAQTMDQFIAGVPGSPRLLITNEMTNRRVHQWRSEEAAILVGRRTVEADDPGLTNRLWVGGSPLRLVLDPLLQLKSGFKILDGSVPTIIFYDSRHRHPGNVTIPNLQYVGIATDNAIAAMISYLFNHNISSVLVEGGSVLLQSFIDAGVWDEMRVITNDTMRAGAGLPAPRIPALQPVAVERSGSDITAFFINQS